MQLRVRVRKAVGLEWSCLTLDNGGGRIPVKIL